MKKILAVAIASAFAAPAFAATANVDVYGRINTAFSFIGGDAENAEDVQLTNFGSRLGFKGSEDLGGGLKAIWQIESSINTEEGNGGLAARNSFVGVAGGFGTVLAGKHDTPLKLVGRKVDLFGDTFGDSRNLLGGYSDTRASNVVAYASPNLSGFSVLAAYTTDLAASNNAADNEDFSAWNVNLEYGNGPIYVGFAYGDGDAHETIGVDEHWRLAGSYSFGDFKIVGQYDVAADAYFGFDDLTGWMVGGAYKMGAMTFKANYMDSELGSYDADQWALGVDYALSKRTTVYALWTQQSGDYSVRANGNFDSVALGHGAGATDVVTSTDDKISALSIGVAHNF
jgi:predicted porin